VDLVLGVRVGGQVFEERLHPAVPDVRRRVRGVQPGDVGAQLADLGDQGLGLSHSTSISALTPMSTAKSKNRQPAARQDAGKSA
jgi:hypothetical protein